MAISSPVSPPPAPPRFGLFLPQIDLPFPELSAVARRAEEVGFGHLWFIDHLDLPGYEEVLEGWTVASAIAGLTETIRIGHLVLCAGFRHPALLGKMAITLDRISGGRLDLGLGWGASSAEMADYGLPALPGRIRRAQLVETVAILRLMLAGGTVAYRGKFYTVRSARCGSGAVQTQVPIFIGGAGPATMTLVREHADWWNCPSYALADLPSLAHDRGTARISANYSVLIDQRSRAPAQLSGNPRSPVLSGSLAALAEVLLTHRALGVELFNLQFVQPHHLFDDIEAFMDHVAPEVAAVPGLQI